MVINVMKCLELILNLISSNVTWMPRAAKEVGRPRSCASWAQPSARAQGEEEGSEGNMIGDSSLMYYDSFSVQVYCITNEPTTTYMWVSYLYNLAAGSCSAVNLNKV